MMSLSFWWRHHHTNYCIKDLKENATNLAQNAFKILWSILWESNLLIGLPAWSLIEGWPGTTSSVAARSSSNSCLIIWKHSLSNKKCSSKQKPRHKHHSSNNWARKDTSLILNHCQKKKNYIINTLKISSVTNLLLV